MLLFTGYFRNKCVSPGLDNLGPIALVATKNFLVSALVSS